MIEADHVDNLALALPPDLLLPLIADRHGIHGLMLPPDSEASVALVLHMEDLWLRLPTLTQEEAVAESRSLAAMLAAVIGAHADRRSMARSYLRKNQFGAICRWIETNLHEPDLEPATITGKFYITRPTLYRMFEQRGGIMKYILERRWKTYSGICSTRVFATRRSTPSCNAGVCAITPPPVVPSGRISG